MVTIEVSEDIWRALMLKKRPGDSFDDVLRRELLERLDPEPEAGESADRYADIDFPRGVDRPEAIAAIGAAVRYLETEGTATMREIVTEVSAEHPLKYGPQSVEKGERYRGAWWRKVIKPGLEAHSDVSKPQGGRRAWVYDE